MKTRMCADGARLQSLAAPSAVIALALLGLAACSPGRAIEAGRLLSELSAGTGEATTAPAVRRSALAGTPSPSDLYLADAAPKAALVLVPGLVPRGKDDPRLVAFAETLARARFLVLVPDLPGFREQRVGPEDAETIADAVDVLAARCFAPQARPEVGLAAISYAAGPAVLAMLDHDAERRVRLLLAIGGYHGTTATMTFFTTGHHREAPGEGWRHRPPNPYGKWAFVLANADRLPTPADREGLAAIAGRKLQDPEADVADLTGQLGPEGRSVMALIDNRDPDRVPALIAALPPGLRANIEALDLARRDLSGLDAAVILIHGRDDPVIPSSESRALAAALLEDRVSLHVVDSLAHVELGPGGLHDIFRLWRAAHALLAERDALPRPDPDRCLDAKGPTP